MKQFKKILYLRTDIYYHSLKAGGSVSHTLGVIEGFLEEGIEVHCASSCMIEQLEELNLKSLCILSLPTIIKLLRWKISCIFSNFFFFRTLARIYKNQNFDYIYQRYSILNSVGLLARWWFKVPLILEYNGSEVWVISKWAPRNWFQLVFLVRWFEIINLKKSDFIVVVSHVLKDDLIGRGVNASKILVNPNGVNPKHFAPALVEKYRNKIREQLHIQNKFVFGFVGTFEQWHGISILEKIIPAIYSKNKNIHWLLIGDGPSKKFLEKALQGINSFTFTGLVDPKMARTYLAACDAFICPTQPNSDGTKFFGSPTKIFEYMCLKKPIIASDLEPLADIFSPAKKSLVEDFEGNELGYLISPENQKVYKECCLHVANSYGSTEYTLMGANAYEKVKETYTWQKHVARIIKFVEGATKSRF